MDNSYVSLPYLLVTLASYLLHDAIAPPIGSYRVVSHVVVATMWYDGYKAVTKPFQAFLWWLIVRNARLYVQYHYIEIPTNGSVHNG